MSEFQVLIADSGEWLYLNLSCDDRLKWNILGVAIICISTLWNKVDLSLALRSSDCSVFISNQFWFLFSRFQPLRVPLLQRVLGEGGHHHQPRRVSDHLVLLLLSVLLLLLFFPLLGGQVPQRGRGHPFPIAVPWVAQAGGRDSP